MKKQMIVMLCFLCMIMSVTAITGKQTVSAASKAQLKQKIEDRTEKRPGGKEGRSRWSPDH